MTTRMQQRPGLVIVLLASTVIGACGGDPLSPPVPGVSTLAVALEDHPEPDPRIPPVCHGATATIWWNMPADMIPKGARIERYVPDLPSSPHGAAGALEDDGGWGYRIIGTAGNDVIVGSPKRDRLFGGNGDDVICADPPTHVGEPGDHASAFEHDGGNPGHGGGGPDRVWGGYGDDRIYGGGGPDTIVAGHGDDTVLGGGGPDVIIGEDGDDLLYGGPGPDRLYGGEGRDRLWGDVSNDFLFGEGGRDWLYGGTGRDLLDGGGGDNFLDPGDQTDEPDHGH